MEISAYILEEVEGELVASSLARTAKCCRAIRCGGVTEAMFCTRLFVSFDFSVRLSTR